jgi:HK97 gp10 family phage protein
MAKGNAYVQLQGLDEINKKLAMLSGKEGKAAIRKGMRRSLGPVLKRAKELEPKGETGTLKKAVKLRVMKRKKGRVGFTVGFSAKAWKASKYYGSFRDKGTKKMKGSNAIRQAYLELGKPTSEDAERQILAECMKLIEGKG